MPAKVTMPALSPTMTEGTLAKWLKKEGEKVKAGDVIAEIETDKATMEVEAVDEGVLGKILVPAGTQNVAVNSTIALLLEEGEDKQALEGFKDKPTVTAAPAAQKSTTTSAPTSQSSAPQRPASGSGRVFASPLAKRIAKERGIDLS